MKSKYKSKEEVHKRALEIKGISQKNLINKLNLSIKGNKNAMGDIFEAWFGKTKDILSEPDLGVSELKATPFKALKKHNKYSAKERLVLNIINYMELKDESFNNSHFLNKNKVLEIAYYEHNPNISKDEWFFKYIILYELMKNPADYEIIKKDWETIRDMVIEGTAENLSENLTNYLAACTKGRNKKSMRKQPFSKIPAKQRAFSFKSGFMNSLLQQAIKEDNSKESIIKNMGDIKNNSLNELIIEKFNPYVGMNKNEIAKKLNITSKAKNKNNIIVRNILGLRSIDNLKNISEFQKANIVPKTIQFNEFGKNKESMSLPVFKFENIVSQSWENEFGDPEAELNKYLHESKFLFIVFQINDQGENIFKGIKFYNIPINDIDHDIKDVWNDTKNKLLSGVNLTYYGYINKNGEKRHKVCNNFVGIKEHKIVHVRPHSGKGDYFAGSNSNKLPNQAIWTNNHPIEYSNEYMPTQSFWLNNVYLQNIVKDLLF